MELFELVIEPDGSWLAVDVPAGVGNPAVDIEGTVLPCKVTGFQATSPSLAETQTAWGSDPRSAVMDLLDHYVAKF